MLWATLTVPQPSDGGSDSSQLAISECGCREHGTPKVALKHPSVWILNLSPHSVDGSGLTPDQISQSSTVYGKGDQ